MSDETERTGDESEPAGTAATGDADMEGPAPGEAEHTADDGDVEVIDGHAVGFAFLAHYREHPEIGPPVAEQVGDDQEFEHAILHWTGSVVEVTWRERGQSSAPDRASTEWTADAPTVGQRSWWRFW